MIIESKTGDLIKYAQCGKVLVDSVDDLFDQVVSLLA